MLLLQLLVMWVAVMATQIVGEARVGMIRHGYHDEGHNLVTIPANRNLQSLQEDLDAARTLWETTARQDATTMNYAYGVRELRTLTTSTTSTESDGETLEHSKSQMYGPLTVDVREDVIIFIAPAPTFARTNDQLSGQNYDPNTILTMEGYFDFIQEAIDDIEMDIFVAYHKTYGYPLRIERTIIRSNEVTTVTTSSTIVIESMLLLTVLNRDLAYYKALWDESNISDYQYVVGLSSSTPSSVDVPTYLVQVQDDVRTSTIHVESGEPAEVPTSYPTVAEAFGIIQLAIEDRYASLFVNYDELYGFPSLINYDIQILHPENEKRYEFTEFVQGTDGTFPEDNAPQTDSEHDGGSVISAIEKAPTGETSSSADLPQPWNQVIFSGIFLSSFVMSLLAGL